MEIKGYINAKSKDEALVKLYEKGFIPIRLNLDIKINYKLNNHELYLFFYKLSILASSGVDIKTSLEIIGEELNNKIFSSAIEDIIIEIESGKKLSVAMKNTKLFPDISINMIYISEETGKQDMILEKLSYYFKKQNEIEKTIKKFTTYPKFLAILSFSIILSIFIFLMPKFSEIITVNNIELPLITSVLINLSSIIINHYIALLILVFIIVSILFYLKHNNKLEIYKYKLSLFKGLNIKIEIYRIIFYLYLMYSSGLSILSSLNHIISMTKSYYINNKLQEIKNDLEEGISLYNSVSNIIPDMKLVNSSIKIGENSGKMDIILENLYKYYESEIELEIENIIKLIEPVSILVISIVIGIIIISLLLPILNLMNSII